MANNQSKLLFLTVAIVEHRAHAQSTTHFLYLSVGLVTQGYGDETLL
jgi:hypothetical protein